MSNQSGTTDGIMAEYAIKDLQQAIVAEHNNGNPHFLSAKIPATDKSSTMNTSLVSTLDDSTPSDSGVHLLDSVSSMNASLMSNSGFEFDLTPAHILPADDECTASQPLPDLLLASLESSTPSVAMEVDSSIAIEQHSELASNIPDEMKTSTCSTFDPEPIVYRRKTKKSRTHSASSGPKKRVSFHEDILKNTKTDNIHIEHGFITYKGYSKKHPQISSRYSWCSEGAAGQRRRAEQDEDDEEYTENSQYYYRNACSDVLDYGKTDLYEKETMGVQYDNSGVFEYGPPQVVAAANIINNNGNANQSAVAQAGLYQCHCSSSNSSLDSGDSNDNTTVAKRNYGQAKSNSCDCIGIQPHIQQTINDNCYFSEPSIERMDDDSFENVPAVKSVWSKEKKPKSSCLKRGRRQTGVIEEYDLSQKMKSFNVHQKLPDMNNIIDNSKNIFGSLKQIFQMPLPERGVPEGCEDQQSVYECVPEVENYSPAHKPKAFLSKSFDGGLAKGSSLTPPKKKYVHNVDEQLRHKKESPREPAALGSSSGSEARSTNEEFDCPMADHDDEAFSHEPQEHDNHPSPSNNFRNKYIINCESTVFEHTGVSYESDTIPPPSLITMEQQPSPLALPTSKPVSSMSFSVTMPFRKKFSNMIRSFRDTSKDFEQNAGLHKTNDKIPTVKLPSTDSYPKYESKVEIPKNPAPIQSPAKQSYQSIQYNVPMSMDSSIISDFSMCSSTTQSTLDKPEQHHTAQQQSPCKSRHLVSPMRKKSLTTRFERSRMSPDLFGGGRESKCTLSEEFDDILTITTTTTSDPVDSSNDSELVIVDYPEQDPLNFPKPPSAASSSSKSSLINRFLRNVTQKKIQDATIQKNTLLASQVKHNRKLFDNIYVKGARPRNPDLIDDLNAEIALEIELSGCGSGVTSTMQRMCLAEQQPEKNEFGLGVGEMPADVFAKKRLPIFRDDREILMKVFKLYTGYSLEGHMTPVLVFLTDKTLYVTDLIRNRLFNKFVLPYTELDVILIGPHGNTVLLSNSARDMQQVLLAGGPYPADGLVSSLEMCARRGGSTLPAVGQLTLDHLAPLQHFVRENSSVAKNDPWVYYAVVSVPANLLNHDSEPMGPHNKGPLMFRNMSFNNVAQQWQAGYFLLKAGVLYMFQDALQKIPSLVFAMAECKGARRATSSTRPHCFEMLLKDGYLQLAAPDEYVASEWLQALVQAASGLFEMQERHKALGCTLVLTSNHLITLREDFSAPLRRVNSQLTQTASPRKLALENSARKLSTSTLTDTFNDNVSNVSTSTRMSDSRRSSNISSPTRSDAGRSPRRGTASEFGASADEKSFTSMSSIYGKNSGVEIKTCASLQEMSTVRIPAQGDRWWCILEFTCQEVRENSDDMVVFFATNSDMRRFLTMLETLWQAKNDSKFPISPVAETDPIGKHCSDLFADINKSWDPLISAALGYAQ